jgi:succinate dehydrogenase / fumarate reductase, cytochrome b subunit
MVAYRQKNPSPLSPFLTVFRWPVSMATSIVHRITGVGLGGGILVLAWWLFAAANGPESYEFFYRHAVSTVGRILIYGFVWAYSYHFLNGVRHLCWDFGYGLTLKHAKITGIAVVALSLLLTAAVFAAIQFDLGGYYDEP